MERSPWWMNIDSSNLPNWKGPVGVKADGGGNIRGQGRVGSMRMHRAVHNKRLDGKGCTVDSTNTVKYIAS